MKEKQRQLLVRMSAYSELLTEETALVKANQNRGNQALDHYRAIYNRTAIDLAELQFGSFLKRQKRFERRMRKTPSPAVVA